MNKTTFAANGRGNVSNVSPSDQIDSGRKKKKKKRGRGRRSKICGGRKQLTLNYGLQEFEKKAVK